VEMKPISTVDFYYFSGTGNTLLVVNKIKEIFERNNIAVNLFRLEKSNPKEMDTSHTIGLGFPVAEQGTFPLVWDFIRAMPQCSGTKVFMVDTMFAFSGGVVGPVRKILKSKGYTTIGAKEICMPNSLFPKKIDEEKNNRIVEKGLLQAERYAEDIIACKSRWSRIPLLSDFMAIFSQAEWCWNLLRKHYLLQVDTSKCSQCGLCESLCPVGNIEMQEFPVIREYCTICMRCISFCPKKAIARTNTTHERYRAVNVKEIRG